MGNLEDAMSALAAHLVAPQDTPPPAWQWREDTPPDRVTIHCGDCGRRIAWWTADVRPGWLGLQDLQARGWKWHGPLVPIGFRGPHVNVRCPAPSCEWTRDGVASQPDPDRWWQSPPLIMLAS